MAPTWSSISPTLDPSRRPPPWNSSRRTRECRGGACRRPASRRTLHRGQRSFAGQRILRAKVVQKELIKRSGIPCTVVRSTQFMEFLGSIADAGQKDGVIHIATSFFQPIAADDVAAIVADTAA